MKILLLLLLASAAKADTTIQPCDQARLIYEIDIAPKSSSSSISRTGDVCTIEWTPKAGQTIAFTDKQAQENALRAELRAIIAKDDSGSALTAAENRRFRKIVYLLLRLDK